jgi:hypothetical protein
MNLELRFSYRDLWIPPHHPARAIALALGVAENINKPNIFGADAKTWVLENDDAALELFSPSVITDGFAHTILCAITDRRVDRFGGQHDRTISTCR